MNEETKQLPSVVVMIERVENGYLIMDEGADKVYVADRIDGGYGSSQSVAQVLSMLFAKKED
jgi:hypothetical protein